MVQDSAGWITDERESKKPNPWIVFPINQVEDYIEDSAHLVLLLNNCNDSISEQFALPKGRQAPWIEVWVPIFEPSQLLF
jgi:hypothetical protein